VSSAFCAVIAVVAQPMAGRLLAVAASCETGCMVVAPWVTFNALP